MEHYIEIDVEDKRSLKPFSSKQQDHDGLSAHAAPPKEAPRRVRNNQASSIMPANARPSSYTKALCKTKCSVEILKSGQLQGTTPT
jgi:hypothetical protein